MIRDALLPDDTTSLRSCPSETPDGINWKVNNSSSSNSVSERERKRGREREARGDDDTDGFPSKRHIGSVHGRKSPLPTIVTSPSVLEEQEKPKRQQQAALSAEDHEENVDDMAIWNAYIRDPNSDDDVFEGIRANRAKAAAAAVTASSTFNGADRAGTGGQSDVGGVTGVGEVSKSPRRPRVKQRFRTWWDRCNSPDFPEFAFRRAFRMSRATFHMICDELRPVVAREDTVLRAAIPVPQRVAACIWRLATGDPLRFVSRRFGIGLATCHRMVPEVCAAITSVLSPKFLTWPSGAALQEIKRRFESLYGIPNVVGSMHTTHIPINAPKRSEANVAAYLNQRHSERCQKTSYSITVQGVVGPDGVFTDVCIGWPGSMADDKVLENSALYQRAMDGALKGQWIVGGTGYPLLDWLLVPYGHQNLTWERQAFNQSILEVLQVAQEAFVRLKSRWRCTLKRSGVNPQELRAVLGACCVLHNVCETRKEEMDPQLRVELDNDETVLENKPWSATAEQERDIVARKLFRHDLTGLSSWLLGGTEMCDPEV